jgi:hypothetical protein
MKCHHNQHVQNTQKDNTDQDNSSSLKIKSKSQMPPRIRVLIIICLIFFLLLHNYINFYPNEKTINKCNIDQFFEITSSLNKFIYDHAVPRKLLVITSSLIIDISVISLSICWVLMSRTWRPLITIGLFYALRGACNVMFAMKYPENIIWEFPGIPAFSISYHDTSDFFFSGHVGINLISAIELKRFKCFKLSCLSYFGVFFQILTMLTVRGHYSIDLIAGLISAHYCDIMSFKIASYVDSMINVDHKVSGFLFTKTELINLHEEFVFPHQDKMSVISYSYECIQSTNNNSNILDEIKE